MVAGFWAFPTLHATPRAGGQPGDFSAPTSRLSLPNAANYEKPAGRILTRRSGTPAMGEESLCPIWS